MIYKVNKNKLKTNTKTQKGNTLIEALVSLTILSFGLLGIAGLLLASTGQQKNSQSYGVASILVNDITERMRANRMDLALANNNYITPNITTYQQALTNAQNVRSSANNGDDDDGASSSNCNIVGGNCSAPGVLATSDLQTWLTRVNTELPGGAGRILQLNQDDNTSRQVVIMWNDKATSTTENANTAVDNVNCPTNVLGTNTPITVRCITVSFRP